MVRKTELTKKPEIQKLIESNKNLIEALNNLRQKISENTNGKEPTCQVINNNQNTIAVQAEEIPVLKTNCYRSGDKTGLV